MPSNACAWNELFLPDGSVSDRSTHGFGIRLAHRIEIEFGYYLLRPHTADISGSHQWDVDVRNEAVDRVAQHHQCIPAFFALFSESAIWRMEEDSSESVSDASWSEGPGSEW